ncbi:MAG: hypothetical protein Q8P41_24950 [Pseudomonadota bacterium]|nr:hypothetical protein [Pseudomonadota bacterium]
MLFLLSTACIQVHRPSCESEEVVLGDDETIGDLAVSAADLLAVIEGTHAFAGAYAAGGSVTGTATVARGVGDVIGIDSTTVDTVTNGGFGIGDETLMIAVECVDSLRIPVAIALRTDDGLVDVSLAGLGTADTRGNLVDGVPEFFEAGGDIAAADIVAMPEPTVADPVAALELQWTSERFAFVSLWWDGDDYEQVLEATPAE